MPTDAENSENIRPAELFAVEDTPVAGRKQNLLKEKRAALADKTPMKGKCNLYLFTLIS